MCLFVLIFKSSESDLLWNLNISFGNIDKNNNLWSFDSKHISISQMSWNLQVIHLPCSASTERISKLAKNIFKSQKMIMNQVFLIGNDWNIVWIFCKSKQKILSKLVSAKILSSHNLGGNDPQICRKNWSFFKITESWWFLIF